MHTGIEKSCEDQQYWKGITFIERMDYLAYYFNAMAYCMAVETLLDEEVPARAQYLRVIHLELNRIASHLFWIGTSAVDIGAFTMLFWALSATATACSTCSRCRRASACTRATSRSAA